MSMTIQEAIRALHLPGDHLKDYDEYGIYIDDELKEAMQMAITAIREKAEREDPKPLTYEDLQHMHGEPVYVTVPGKPHRNKWCIVDLTHPQPGLRGVDYSCSIYLTATNAVKVYRHKPKEV